MVKRRDFILGAGVALAAPALVRAQPRVITDILGNQVELAGTPERIVLLDATDYFSVSALIPDPFDRIVGWASAARLDLGATSILDTVEIPEVGNLSPDTVSLEAIIALQPDMVVASNYMLPQTGSVIEDTLNRLSIPVVWTSGHDDALSPDLKLARAMNIWGSTLDQQDRAQEILDLAIARYGAVRACAKPNHRPRTYMEIQTTYDQCCWAAGRAFFGDLFDIAGGELLAGSDGWGRQLSEEGLISLNPEVYIATGGNFVPARQPGIGPGLDVTAGRAGLVRAADRVALRNTPAVQNNRVHGIWTGLITSPLLTPILAEYLAMWLHPSACASLDPDATLAKINTFLSQPIPGPLGLSTEAS